MIKIIISVVLLFITLSVAFAQTMYTEDLLKEAKYLRAKGLKASAISIYSQILEEEPENTENLLDFADLMIEIENYSYAIILYTKYLNLKPEDIKIRELLIDIYTSTLAYDKAEEECLTFLKKYPYNTEMLSRLAYVYRTDHQIGKEMIITEEILKLQPTNKEATLRLLDLYVILREYKKASDILTEDNISYSLDKAAYIYLNAGEFDKAIELYQKIYEENPTEENKFSLKQAKLAEINYNIYKAPRFYNNYVNPLMSLLPPDNYTEKLTGIARDELSGIYTGAEYTGGKINNQNYSNYYISFFYPFLNTGTEILITANRYEIRGDNVTGIYNRGEIELRQSLNEHFTLGGGYGSGTPGINYYSQIAFKSDIIDIAVRYKKEFQLETAEAMKETIYYKGMDYYGNWNVTDRFNLIGRFSDYDYSDGNNGTYNEVGGFYRLWDNNEDTWITGGITHTGEHHTFQTPLYYSPADLSQWNYSIEWDYYWKPDSLLRLNYMYSSNNLDQGYHVYSIYGDHKFTEDFFIYGEYINGLSRIRSTGVTQPDNRDYQATFGIKYKF
ncbi:MAG TPA: hypothetical protein PL110_06085 [Candidatus Eremiobacteraeota bacterium]|nr:MAG: hypothetical protein BWY64_03833 [bacterium ADurb.Bin363]HPZ07662.1 hypothetical protein [Candidatus Eremiobacteraeota bacterium]